MKAKDTKKEFKKNTDAFILSLMDMAKAMQDTIKEMNPEEAIKLGHDSDELMKKAKEKTLELNREMAVLQNKIKNL